MVLLFNCRQEHLPTRTIYWRKAVRVFHHALQHIHRNRIEASQVNDLVLECGISTVCLNFAWQSLTGLRELLIESKKKPRRKGVVGYLSILRIDKLGPRPRLASQVSDLHLDSFVLFIACL